MDFDIVLKSVLSGPVLFFFVGLLAGVLKSDLEIPPTIGKFLSIYLLFVIGLKGGEELHHSGFTSTVALVIVACLTVSFCIPFLCYRILRIKLDVYNAGAIAATYGSISAVTFANGLSFLESSGVAYGGYMVAGMALMESPAIIAGLILIQLNQPKSEGVKERPAPKPRRTGRYKDVLKKAFLNSSVFLLLSSMLVGLLIGDHGHAEIKPFANDIFKGMLCLFMLDNGIVAARRISELRVSGGFLTGFALIFPLVVAPFGILISYLLGFDIGDALLFTILSASASYIAVPVAMRLAVPQTNMSLLLPMSLGITFSFNIVIGIPLYYFIIKSLWS